MKFNNLLDDDAFLFDGGDSLMLLNTTFDPFIAKTKKEFYINIRDFVDRYRKAKIANDVGVALQYNRKANKNIKLSINDVVLIIRSLVPVKLINLSGDSNIIDPDSMLICSYNYFGKDEGLYTNSFLNYFVENIIGDGEICDRSVTLLKVLSNLRMSLINDEKSVVSLTSDPNRTIVNNGIFNHETKELESFSPDYIAITKPKTNYNKDAQSPVISNPDGSKWDIDSWLRGLAGEMANQFDQETYDLMWQMIRSSLNPYGINQKILILYAKSGNNGKGTFGELLKQLVGSYSTLSMETFGRTFGLEPLIGSKLNIADENIVDGYIDGLTSLKSLTTGDDILINRKGLKMIPAKVVMTNIQMMNGLPKTKDKTDSLYRRFRIVEFLTSFTNNGEKSYIKTDYIKRKEVLEYVMKKSLEMDGFTEFVNPQRSVDALAQYEEEDDPVVEFWNEFSGQFEWDAVPTQFAYLLFVSWFIKFNPKGFPVKKSTFLESTEKWMRKASNGWCYKAKASDKVNVLSKMDADEPLITEYNLEDYYDKSYQGLDPVKKRNFKRPKSIRGFVRL